MSPRFWRYLRRALLTLLLMLSLVLALNWLGRATGLTWLRVDLGLAVVIWGVLVGVNWLTRADPERRE